MTHMTGAPKSTSSRLFTLYPGQNYDGLILRYPHQSDSQLEYCFAEAAERLAASYTGRPHDDTILYPFLFLYRHAIELALKDSIRLAARLRRNNGEDDMELGEAEVRARLRNKHRHSIGALLHELDGHLEALDQPRLPKKTKRMLTAIATTDPKGESFRYAGSLTDDVQHALDFHQLAAALKEAYGITSATYDMLDHYGDVQADWMEDMRQLQAEFDSEMRAEYEADMRAEFDADMRAEYESDMREYYGP